MKLLFCNIAWLDYYKGIYEGVDMPVGGEIILSRPVMP